MRRITEQNPQVMAGKRVFTGTRVPVKLITRKLKNLRWRRIEIIRAAYPTLGAYTDEEILAVCRGERE